MFDIDSFKTSLDKTEFEELKTFKPLNIISMHKLVRNYLEHYGYT